MAKIKYDASEIEDAPQFEQAPIGLYRFKIASAEEGDSKAGQPMLTARLELTHDAQGKKLKKNYGQVWHRVPLGKFDMTPGWAFRFTEFLNALGLKSKGTLDTDKLEGLTGQVKLRSGKDEDGEYRPEVSKLFALSDDGDDDDDDADETEAYTEDDLKEMENDELKEAAEEVGVDVPKRLTTAGKKKLIAAILEAQDEEDDDEDDTDEDEDEDTEAYDEDTLAEMDADELSEVADELGVTMPKGKLVAAKKKRLIAALLEAQSESEDEDEEEDEDDEDTDEYDEMSKSQLVKEARSRKLKVKSSHDEDDIREMLRENDGEDEEDEDDDDSEDEDYDSWELDDLKNELKERGLKVTGRKQMLVARLKKDDESGDDPF